MLKPDIDIELRDKFLADAQGSIPGYIIEKYHGNPVVKFDVDTDTQTIYDTLKSLADYWHNNLPDALANTHKYDLPPVGYIVASERKHLVDPKGMYIIDLIGDQLVTQDGDIVAPSNHPIDDKYVEKYKPSEHMVIEQDVEAMVWEYVDKAKDIVARGGSLTGDESRALVNQLYDELGLDAPPRRQIHDWKRTVENSDVENAVHHAASRLKSKMRGQEEKHQLLDQADILRTDMEAARARAEKIPSGKYQVENGELVRIGDAEELTRYRGMLLPKDVVNIDFNPTQILYELRYRPIVGSLPSVFVTRDKLIAAMYAAGSLSESGQIEDDEHGLIYAMKVRPNVQVNVDDCTDENEMRPAMESGADVIECWQDDQIETIIFDANDIVEITDIHQLKAPTSADAINITIMDRRTDDIILDPIDPSVVKAANEYMIQSRQSRSKNQPEYKGVLDQKTRPQRSGRGRQTIQMR